MPSYNVNKLIKQTSIKCAMAAVPGAFMPGIDIAAVGGLWAYMMTKIAQEHNVTFREDPLKFAGTVAAGVGGYWTGSKLFTWGIGAVLAFFTCGAGLLLIPVSNVLLNGYFTWTVGRRMDAIFAASSDTEAGVEIGKQIVKAVCHLPSRSEMADFQQDVALSVSEVKGWF